MCPKYCGRGLSESTRFLDIDMDEQEPISTAARPPFIAKKPPVPWWKLRSKRQPRKVRVNGPRKRGKSGENPPPQAQSQSTEGATQVKAASNVPPFNEINTFKKRRRKKQRLLVLDSWVSDGTNSMDLSDAPDEEVVLDSWENESLTQPSRGAEDTPEDNGCGLENSGDHVTNNPAVTTDITEESQSNANNIVKVYGQPDQGLSANELKILFQRKRKRKRGPKKKNNFNQCQQQQQGTNQQQKRLAASSKNLTASEQSKTLLKIEPAVKLESPPLTSPPSLLGRQSIQSAWPPTSSIAPRTSTADVLKDLPPISGLTSAFDSSLNDPVRVSPLEQPVHTGSYLSHPHSGISDRPLPLLDSGDLTSRGNPFIDTITPPMPLRRITPEEISDQRTITVLRHQDPMQLPDYKASTNAIHPNPNLILLSPTGTNNKTFTHPPSKSRQLLPIPPARSPPPSLRGGAPSRQLKITSFFSPPKKRLDDPIRLEPEFSNSSLTLPSVGRMGMSTRPPLLSPERPEYSGTTLPPPIAPRDRYFSASELRDSNTMPLSRVSDQESIFSRLDSPTRHRQNHLQFSTDPSQRTLELAQPLRDIHDDPFSRLGPSVTSRNALSMSQFGDSYTSGSVVRALSPSEIDQRRPHLLHTDSLRLPADSMISRPTSDVIVKLEPGMKYEDRPVSSSSCLYQTRPDRLNVAKLVNRFTPKGYQTTDITPQPLPSTSFALVKQEREVMNISSIDLQEMTASSSGERFVDIQDSVRNVKQIPGPSQDSSERTVTEASVSLIDDSTGQDGATDFQIGGDDLDYFRCVQSAGIHIPKSRKKLKVVAIDCEMVGCVRKIPPEQLLASNMKGGATKSGIGVTKVAQGKKGGLRGVLLKTQMKPQVQSKKKKKKNLLNKELSIAARCSIVGYDGSILYDRYINPTIGTNYKIISYRTPWSGIRPHHMTHATPFHVARREILDILQGCIVVGHNIGGDLQSLEIYDLPASQIRDTSFHPTLKSSAGGSRALKVMARILLRRTIQSKSRVGHCSVEDARATMDLYKLVELEWEK